MARIALVHDVAGVAAVQARLLRQAGHHVDQIELPMLGATWRWPFKALSLPVRFAAYLPAVRRLRRSSYDVVHIHWLTQGVVGLLLGRPFIVQAHGSDLHVNLGNPVLRPVTKAVLERARLVLYVTPNLRAYANGDESKLRYLPNPVEVSEVAPDANPPSKVSRVLVFARLDPVKGVDLIFPAAETLSASVELTALDWGPLSAEYVRRYSGLVKFVKPVPHDQIGAFLQRFDIAIGQMRQGILSLSEIEAMAAGRPLITGIDPRLYADDPPPVIRATNAGEVAQAVERLRHDERELARLAREGREWVSRNHGYARHLQLLESAYFDQSNQR